MQNATVVFSTLSAGQHVLRVKDHGRDTGDALFGPKALFFAHFSGVGTILQRLENGVSGEACAAGNISQYVGVVDVAIFGEMSLEQSQLHLVRLALMACHPDQLMSTKSVVNHCVVGESESKT